MIVFHLITRLNVGGTSTWMLKLLSNKKNNFEQILCFGSVDRYEVENKFYLRFNYRRIKYLKKSINPMKDFLALLEIRKMLIEIKPDIINTHTFKSGVIGRIAVLTLLKKPQVVHTYHGHLLYGYFGLFKKFFYITTEKLLSKITDAFIINGNRVKDDLLKVKIISSSNYKVIFPSTNLRNVNLKQAKHFKSKLGIEKNAFVVGWMGRFTEIKRPELVLNIARELPNDNFIMGGKGELFEKLKLLAPENVTFLNWIDPKTFWSVCDIAILTSRNEAIPYALVEAASHKLPIIAPNTGSISDILSKENGIFAEKEKDFVDAITYLKLNTKVRKKMGNVSRNIVKESYNDNTFTTMHFQIYKSLL
mgnify:CR=1 FL=1